MDWKELAARYQELIDDNSVRKGNVPVGIRFIKAKNDLLLARTLLSISIDRRKKDFLGISSGKTFFDWVIISAYYAIFHSAQALLAIRGVKVEKRVHFATFIAFANEFIINGELEQELFMKYKDSKDIAYELLEMIRNEKDKRVIFQYHRLSKFNKKPAEESVENAIRFVDAVGHILSKRGII